MVEEMQGQEEKQWGKRKGKKRKWRGGESRAKEGGERN